VPRALELLQTGDVAGARLWLEQGLAAGEAQAAFHLAETYDPRMLRRWRVVGVTSDPRRARELYRRALEGGVSAAQSRLQ
jgi:TPR repeat protein